MQPIPQSPARSQELPPPHSNPLPWSKRRWRPVRGLGSWKVGAWLAVLAGISTGILPAAVEWEGSRPNILLVLADDLGYGDLGCYGHPVIRTPHLDRFAREGLRFTSAYSAGASCSPSRASLLTGRTPSRVGIYQAIPEQSRQMEIWEVGSPLHLSREEFTVATLLQSAGYATCFVGKWHLNGIFNSSRQPQPGDHGFDYWLATQNNAQPNHFNPFNFVRNGRPLGRLEGYSSTILVDEALAWLQETWAKDRPFCLFLWLHSPHEHLATAPEFRALYPGDPGRAVYYGNVTQMDHEFGRLMEALDVMGLRDDTLVLFTSDNGPAYQVPSLYGSAGPLRGKKGQLYEGGIRVPALLRWPGRIPAGQVSHEPVSGTDLLPTLCRLAGAPVPADRFLDGTDWLPLFQGRKIERSVPLFWQYLRTPPGFPQLALRKGEWKILAFLDRNRMEELSREARNDPGTYVPLFKGMEPQRFELYHLQEDPQERTNLAGQEVEKREEMAHLLELLYRQVWEDGPEWPPWRRPSDPAYEPYLWPRQGAAP